MPLTGGPLFVPGFSDGQDGPIAPAVPENLGVHRLNREDGERMFEQEKIESSLDENMAKNNRDINIPGINHVTSGLQLVGSSHGRRHVPAAASLRFSSQQLLIVDLTPQHTSLAF
ncbi:hypothetical protein I7I51_01297 [Histoplasma capsulatum]|uniref:Uncharacterized protein n=1 Tax=Ajellomyces capsulatus TaxID=5037 RepID=A0A8A1MI33_AJECA|nr:predicted protein [Histoplasma mississippiense (nom. inval.)]EDN10649.1 predicted protein [Histoplasma mississippiense (nom. inval.)]QSS64232.1 hypothetical protein I7I51_01297 [Histoplasma capsulatum]